MKEPLSDLGEEEKELWDLGSQCFCFVFIWGEGSEIIDQFSIFPKFLPLQIL